MYILIAIIIIIGLVGVIYFVFNSNAATTVANGDTVSVYYTGTLTNGTQFGSNFGEQPLNFTVGANQVILGFNQAVLGMKLNETKNITIPANQAYGEVNQSLIVGVPLGKFQNSTVHIGEIVTEGYSGQQIQGTVTAFNLTNVTVDFNPPLAGQTLIFKIKIAGIHKK